MPASDAARTAVAGPLSSPLSSPPPTPLSTLARRGRVAISAAFFAQGCVFAIVLTHLGAFETAWHLDDLAITVIMFVVALLAAGGSVIAGLIAARRGSGVALRVGLVAIFAAMLLAALAPDFVVFRVGLAVYGLALGCVDATTNMQAVAAEALAGRSIMTSFYAAWSVGGIVGALETSVTANWPLTASLLLALIPPAAAVGLPVLADRAASSPRTGMTPEPTRAAAPPRIPWKPLAILGAAIVLFYVADSATQSWSTIYLSGVLGATTALAPIGYAAYQATSLAARIGGDFLVRRLGPTTVVRLAAIVGAAGLATAVAARNPAAAIAGFAILGLGIAVVAPLTFAAAGRLADTVPGTQEDPAARRRAADAIVARINQFNYLGFVLGGVLTGLVGSASSMRAGFVVPLIGILAILPIARAFGGRRRARSEKRAGSAVTP